MRNTLVAGATALAVAGAVLVTAPVAGAAGGRGTTKLHGTKGHSVSIAKTLRPGVVHFRNTGKDAVLVVRKHKADAKALAKIMNNTKASTEKRALKTFDFIEISYPKSDSWVKLARGTYYVVDLGVDKIKAAKIRTVTVKGHKQNATVPKATTVVFNAKGYVPASTTMPRKSAVRVVNHSKHLAYALTLKIKSSVTDADIQKIVAHPSSDDVFGTANDEYDFALLPAIVGPKHSVVTSTKLGAGRYFLVTGSSDKLHAGQVGLLTVR